MLILNIGDAHITGRNPIARLDDLVEVQFIKWREIVSIANKFDCPIVSTGDILNVPIIANSILTIFGEIIRQLKHSLYFVWGNHDLMYHSLDMYQKTSLGMLWHNNNKIKHISEFYDNYGVDWDYYDWNQKIINNNSDLLLMHKAVVIPKMVGGNNSWILKDTEFSSNIQEDKELQKYKLIICGHWHKRYRFSYRTTTVINPGPITRRSIEETDVPTVQLINLENKIRRVIKLESAKPTEEVISEKHMEGNIHKVKADIADFVNALKKKKLKHASSFLDNLMFILDSHELDKNVEKLIRELVILIIEKKGKVNE